MPTFIFNKLIRDKLAGEYERMNQKATYRTLSKAEHSEALKQKINEEARELIITSSTDDIVGELADIKQAIGDLQTIHDIGDDHIENARQKKFVKKGGFNGANYVETLELADDDEWVDYYRASPDVFVEKGGVSLTIEYGEYEHYKGSLYEVIGLAKHTEDSSWLVMYRPLNSQNSVGHIWARPYAMFMGSVTIDGKHIPRFKKVSR